MALSSAARASMFSRARPARRSPLSNGSSDLALTTKAANAIDNTEASSTGVVQIRHLPDGLAHGCGKAEPRWRRSKESPALYRVRRSLAPCSSGGDKCKTRFMAVVHPACYSKQRRVGDSWHSRDRRWPPRRLGSPSDPRAMLLWPGQNRSGDRHAGSRNHRCWRCPTVERIL